MELRSRKVLRMPLPGGDRRGTPGADAGCFSMRSVGGEELSRRALAGSSPEDTTAELIDQHSESSFSNSPFLSVATSPSYKGSSHRSFSPCSSTCSMLLEDVVQKTSLVDNFASTSGSSKEDRLNTIKLAVAKELAESENQNMTPDVESASHRNSDTTSDTEYINSSSILPYSLDHTPNPSTSTSNVQSIAQTSETNDNISNTQSQIEDINDANTMETQLISQLQEVLIEYEQMDPETRPKLPKLKENKKLYRLVNLFNTNILQKFFDEDSDITHIHTLIYCSAVVISQQLGYKINTNSTRQRKKFEKPSWQIRLEKDIGALRADIGRLSQYINNNRSRKLIAKVQTILKKNTIHSTHDNNNRTPQDVLDTLKQKLSLKAHRLARYLKALNRKNDNRLFSNNEKGFYRTLNHNNNSNGNDVLPSEEEVKNYWAGLWEKCQDHNEEAQWVKEEEKKWEAIQEMEFGDITKDDIEVITRKTKNWKAAGLDGIQNVWHHTPSSKEQRYIESFAI
ncbi:hypothetical protein ABMA28_008015 [Loxostege sticticalis]|uniref:Uncharacterized protein n=1 Tax=Loxostege sticticalis TaxID=481309 RepID=A0ABD0SHX2_LOXSC